MWWRREKQEVAEFLYQLLLADAPKGYARTVSERMQIPYPTLSKYWLGKRRFPATLIKPLFLATEQNPRVADFFLLEGSNYQLQRRDEPSPPDDLNRAVMMLGKLEGRISDIYLRATERESEAGVAIGPGEREELRAAIQSLISQAEKLHAAFPSQA